MVKIGIHGASGKMGRMIIECLKNEPNAKLSAAYTIEPLDFALPQDAILTDKFDELFANCDVVIDFTIKEGAINLLNYARTDPKPLVIGTTGLGEDGANLLKLASAAMPILYATNMSLVAVLNRLAALASKALREFDAEIVEQHHRHKKDAPSGTALTLGERVAAARGLNLKDVLVTGRDGLVGARSKDEIAILAVRGGDVVGRHTVGFYNEGEFIELNHTATSRATFAKGAIKAAIWVAGQQSGLYGIDDCLGL